MTEDEFQTAVDDVSGKTLDADKVKAARQLELVIINQYGVWKMITKEEAAARGLSAIPVRCVDANKGDEINEEYRSRLVVKEFRAGDPDTTFVGTPPTEALRYQCSCLATDR